MREAKSKELKKDIEILSQTFERVVDRKDAVIKSLAKDLMEAEEQYSMALRSHLQNIDNLIGTCFYIMCTDTLRVYLFLTNKTTPLNKMKKMLLFKSYWRPKCLITGL